MLCKILPRLVSRISSADVKSLIAVGPTSSREPLPPPPENVSDLRMSRLRSGVVGGETAVGDAAGTKPFKESGVFCRGPLGPER